MFGLSNPPPLSGEKASRRTRGTDKWRETDITSPQSSIGIKGLISAALTDFTFKP